MFILRMMYIRRFLHHSFIIGIQSCHFTDLLNYINSSMVMNSCHDGTHKDCSFNVGLIFLFVLRLNIAVNNFSLMSGLSHSFLGINKYCGELMCQHSAASGNQTQDLSIQSPMLHHRTPLRSFLHLYLISKNIQQSLYNDTSIQ